MNSALVSEYDKTSGKLYLSGQFGENLFVFGGYQLQSLFLPSGYSNSYLMQMNKDGEVDWVRHMGKKYGSTLRTRLLSLENGVVSSFGFNDTALVDATQYITQTEHVIFSKTDHFGITEWVHHLRSDFVQIAGIVEDDHGSLYALGNFVRWLAIGADSIHVAGNHETLDAELFMVKLNPLGQVIWLRHIGGGIGHDSAESLTYSDGVLYGCGRFSSELQLGADIMVSTSFKNGFLFSMDTIGNFDWSHQFMSENAHPMAVKAQSNKVVVSGLFRASLEVQSQQLNGSSGPGDGFVGVFDGFGELLAMKAIGADGTEEVNHIEVISENLIIVSGYSNSDSFSLDGLQFSNTSDGSGGYNQNQFAFLLDSNLTAKCIYTTTSTNSGLGLETNYNHIDADSIWVVSGFWQELVIDGTSLSTNGGSTFVAKTCMSCPELIRLDVDKATPARSAQLHLYPNPATHTVRFQVSGSTPHGRDREFRVESLVITDMLGNTVMNLKPETLNLELDVSGLASGVYTVAAQLGGGEVLRARLVVGR